MVAIGLAGAVVAGRLGRASSMGIIFVYVDDLNIIGTTRDIEESMAYLKAEFEMKDLGKTKFCLGL
jgi:hypothetical protein